MQRIKVYNAHKGSAFITGRQELYVSSDDQFPEGYKLNDTWPQNIL